MSDSIDTSSSYNCGAGVWAVELQSDGKKMPASLHPDKKQICFAGDDNQEKCHTIEADLTPFTDQSEGNKNKVISTPTPTEKQKATCQKAVAKAAPDRLDTGVFDSAYCKYQMTLPPVHDLAAFIPPLAIGVGCGVELDAGPVGRVRMDVGYLRYEDVFVPKTTYNEYSLGLGTETRYNFLLGKYLDRYHVAQVRPTVAVPSTGDPRFALNFTTSDGVRLPWKYLGMGFSLDQSASLVGDSPYLLMVSAEIFAPGPPTFKTRGAVGNLNYAVSHAIPRYRLAEKSAQVWGIPQLKAEYKHFLVDGLNAGLNDVPGTIAFQSGIDEMAEDVGGKPTLGVTLPSMIVGGIFMGVGLGKEEANVPLFGTGGYLGVNGLGGLPRAWWPAEDDFWPVFIWRTALGVGTSAAGVGLLAAKKGDKPEGKQHLAPDGSSPYDNGPDTQQLGMQLLGPGAGLVVVDVIELVDHLSKGSKKP